MRGGTKRNGMKIEVIVFLFFLPEDDSTRFESGGR